MMRNDIVLLLDAEAVQTLIIAQSLTKSGYEVHLICNGVNNYGYHTKYATKKTVWSEKQDSIEYLDFIIKYIQDNHVSTMIPMNDEGAVFMSRNKEKLSCFLPFIMPSWSVFEKGYDKNLLMALCEEKGYPHPDTIDLDKHSYLSISDTDIKWPAIIKPNYTSGGRGMTIVRSRAELIDKYPSINNKYGSCHLQQFISSGGRQIKVQLFIDPKGRRSYSSVIHKQRFYPEKGGSSCCNVTISDDNIVKICFSVLQDIGWQGFADFDLIEDPQDGILKIMEINPRIPACIKSAILSGLDYGVMIADASLGKEIKQYTYKPGQKLRHVGLEWLWFIKSKNRFKTKPSWFNWFGPKLSFQDFNIWDPLPFLYGTIGNIKKQRNSEFKESKGGLG